MRQNQHYAHIPSPNLSTILSGATMILPVGSIEQHGPHLPLSVDLDLASAFGEELCRRISGIMAPAIPYTARSLPHCGGGGNFPGTVHIPGETLISYLVAVISGLVATRELNRLVIINGHYENESYLFEALEQCREQEKLDTVQVIALSWWSVVDDTWLQKRFTDIFPGWHAEHAATVETSLMMFLHPERVDKSKITGGHDTPPLDGIYLHPIDSSAISNQGVLSSLQLAASRLGQDLFTHICDALQKLLQQPHGLK